MFDGKRGWRAGGWRRLTGIRARGRHRVGKRDEQGKRQREREKRNEKEGEAENERPGFVSGRVEGGGTGFHGRLITNGRVSRSSAADSQELELHRRRSIASHPASQAARQPNGLTGREPGRPRTLLCLCLPTYQPNPLPSSRFLAHNPLRQRSPPIDLSVLPREREIERNVDPEIHETDERMD